MYIDVFTTNVHIQVSSQQTYCDEETGSWRHVLTRQYVQRSYEEDDWTK